MNMKLNERRTIQNQRKKNKLSMNKVTDFQSRKKNLAKSRVVKKAHFFLNY